MKTMQISAVLILAMSGILFGCPAPAPEGDAVESPAATPEAVSLPEQVQKAVNIAQAIEADPDRIETILEEAVMTADEFEALLYDIAADPELSRLYNHAMAD